MATGNVGHHLHARQDETNTYFSRDAGRTWEEIRKGSYIYEFGDHGALMVMANNREATNRILYSWNEGLNWTEFQFWEHHIEVENIITEPSGTSQVFIVYGRRNDKGVLMQLNFETLHERRCSGPDPYLNPNPLVGIFLSEPQPSCPLIFVSEPQLSCLHLICAQTPYFHRI
eukprot:930692-Rhodomonas_salina.1